MAFQRPHRGRPARRRIGRVSYCSHHGSWCICYREGGWAVRRRIAGFEADAERVAAQVNAQLASEYSTLFSTRPSSASSRSLV
jgi:hypothetical protein